MKAFKIACLALLALWMAWISLEIEHAKNLAYEACAFAFSATGPRTETTPLPLICPVLANNEFGPQKPK
jgi:hypothetical protein